MRVFIFLLIAFVGCTKVIDQPVHSVTGTVQKCGAGNNDGVKLTLKNEEYGKTVLYSDTDGTFSFDGIVDGEYVLTPYLDGVEFTPTSRTVTVSGGKVDGQDFVTIVSWDKIYANGSKNREVYSIFQTADCGFLLAGYVDIAADDYPEDPDMWILKTDLAGNTQWEYTSLDYSTNFPTVTNPYTGSMDIAFSAIENNNGDILVGAYYLSDTEDTLVKYFKKSSATAWEEKTTTTVGSSYGSTYNEHGYAMDLLDDGNLIVGGYATTNDASGYYGMWLCKYSVSDSTYSAYNYYSAYADQVCTSVHQIGETLDNQNENKYIVGGYKKTSDLITCAVVKMVDSDYTVSWENDLRLAVSSDSSSSGNEINVCVQALHTSADMFVAAGYTAATKSADCDMWIALFNAAGTKQWESVFDFGKDDYVTALCTGGDDGCFYLGGYRKNGARTSLVVAKVSGDGKLLWKHDMNYDADASVDMVKSMVFAKDKTLAVAATSSYMFSRVWLLKLDTDGNLINGLSE